MGDGSIGKIVSGSESEMKREFSDSVVEKLRKALGETGLCHLAGIKFRHGRIDATWMDGPIPHPVHFREGMQIRNMMREFEECEDWTDHDLDDTWLEVAERAISE